MIPVYSQQDEQKKIQEAAQSSTMKNLVALLCMISAIVSSALSYKCCSCFSGNSTTCKESEIECLGNRCMTTSQYVVRNEDVFKSILKSCANETLCGTNGSVTIGHLKLRFYAKCCTGHLCNIGGYELPVEDPTLNGVKCPFAYCIGTFDECNSTKEMNCTGSMNRCFQFTGQMLLPDKQYVCPKGFYADTWKNVSGKGCTNDDACKYNFQNVIGVSERPGIEIKC
ncbi:phospholipase A2 inhibitor and Ly6/PLAUR domain-containing protein-like [Anomaloglossus baeobatrachus]|uniref:phospholipase A2 inhibitor and Ly6/PLAUR domain-containing protein-like n=1 Tax=Anomaloglossus baeobatrachus TaxID=238106 RepID=UPI003F50721D